MTGVQTCALPILLGRQTAGRQWPGEDWGQHALDEFLQTRLPDARLRLHLAADAVSGRAVSPFLTGSALHLLAPGSGRSGTVAGGLGRFGASLETLARKAGVSIRCEAKVAAIGLKRGRANALMLDRGEDIEARAILSTLDFKHTFLELLDTEGNGGTPLPQAARFRIAGQMARVLIALDAPPDLAFAHDDPDAAHGPIHVAGSLQALNRTHDLWHAGTLDVAAPVTLKIGRAHV